MHPASRDVLQVRPEIGRYFLPIRVYVGAKLIESLYHVGTTGFFHHLLIIYALFDSSSEATIVPK